MPATARVEAEVWGDVRFKVLAKQLGCDLYSAIGRMAALWGECTNRCVYVLDAVIVSMYLDCEVEAVIPILCQHAQLGEDVVDGIRIRGTIGRVEWLHKARASGKKGGKARAANAARDGGKFVSEDTPNQGTLEGSTKGLTSDGQAPTKPTATATATATATDQDPPVVPQGDDTKSSRKGRAMRKDPAADLLAKTVTIQLNAHLGKRFDGFSKCARKAARRWRGEGWTEVEIVEALKIRIAKLNAVGNTENQIPETLYNGKLAEYVAMVKNGSTSAAMGTRSSSPRNIREGRAEPSSRDEHLLDRGRDF